MTIDAIKGQSGAGMMYCNLAFPPCSDAAARILRLSYRLYIGNLQTPKHSAHWEREQFETEALLRRLAGDYISQACQDLDALARASKEAAAGRAGGGQAQRRTPPARAPEGVTCL
jgi:hypothetical protein